MICCHRTREKEVLRIVETAGGDARDVDHAVGNAAMGVVGQGRGAVLEDDGGSVG